jgi:hypothetical protein
MVLTVEDPTWSRCDIDGLATCPREVDGSVRFVNSERAGRLQGKPMAANVDLTTATGSPPSAPPSPVESEAPIPPVSGMTLQVALVVNLLAPSAGEPGPVLAATTGGGFISWVGQGVLAEVAADGATGRVTFVDLPVTGADLPDRPDRLSGEVTWLCPTASS